MTTPTPTLVRSRTSVRVALGALAGAGLLATSVLPALAAEAPTLVAGNPTCVDVLGPDASDHKLDFAPGNGTYPKADGPEIVITDATPTSFSWASDTDLAAVIVKGGPMAHVYLYPGLADLADTGLLSPHNDGSGEPYGISHVSFCTVPPVEEPPAEEPPVEEPPAEEPPAEEPPAEQPPAEVEPQVVTPAAPPAPPAPAAQVAGVVQQRPAAPTLPATGAASGLLAGLGAAFVALGTGITRLGVSWGRNA